MLFYIEDPGKAPSSYLLRSPILMFSPQTLKERFAEQLPEKIEQIKKLRKYGPIQRQFKGAARTDFGTETMDQRLLERSPLTKFMEELVESSRWSGKDLFLTLRRVSVSGERQFQSARNCFRKPRAEKSLSQKVQLLVSALSTLLIVSRSFLAALNR